MAVTLHSTRFGRLEVPAGGESKNDSGYRNKVVLEDGFFARNLQLTN